ncbi:hypothetical protein MMAG44476_22102 [Mycolicibacterium mageritense DSM 44476 = CIP 104973]|jgi:hypothetical protein|uniref:Lysyl oxidase homolog 2 n=1 Tax=Mycolicibacterium canariasense TaxID=228230 RepID=A0A100WB76_MYCCR|nr:MULTISPECIES: hypothetical protein [Mycolicibacterium]MCC9179496.1 hypothetical protein [Mycolicibacterium mageritense]MCV7211498.1 hypothetical protein [Mycolicibacterium canariasense]GAS94839.1 lysyl oxidase homolog 2 [Mycolicibacterium canariasense]
MSVTTSRAAAQAAMFLEGRSADDLGWPDRDCVARQFAAAVLTGLGPEQWGTDPVTWCIEVLEPAIERRIPGPHDDLRALGWPHTPTVAANLVQWLVDDGILAENDG